MSRSFTVFFPGTRVYVDLLIVAFCLVDYILYLALSAWDGFAEAKVLRLVKLFRIIRSLRAVRILRTIRSPPPTGSAFYLFFYLFAHKTLHTYCNVQREQDNKAQITGTNSCPLSLDHTATDTNTMQCI